MSVDHLRYDLLAQNALRGMVRTVLVDTARKGLPGQHHFFISFDTRADGVRVSTRLREQYPDEMTIVLQHQFWDLKVDDDEFEVGLSFNGVAERLTVPFAAIKSFVDPSVQFVLQFEPVSEGKDEATPSKPKGDNEAGKPRRQGKQEPRRSVPSVPRAQPASPAETTAAQAPPHAKPTLVPRDDKPDKSKRGADVVRLDKFRKK